MAFVASFGVLGAMLQADAASSIRLNKISPETNKRKKLTEALLNACIMSITSRTAFSFHGHASPILKE
jgi:hypothetical protein